MNKPFIFFEDSFPNHATHCAQTECGFSIRRNILIQWDEDADERILFVIDGLPDFLCEQIVVAQEHEGSIWIVWKPGGLEVYTQWIGFEGVASLGVIYRQQEIEVCGDTWSVEHTLAQKSGLVSSS